MPVESPIPPRKNYSDLVAAYALRLHAAAGDQHHIISPLGAWLVLALAAPLVTSGEREALERVLGCDVDTARRAADEMLVDPHPAVEMALAMWHRGDIGPALDAWGRSLPACATTGPVPTQAKVDAWAQEKSKGQIESMPVALDEFTRLLLATAVATEVQWSEPFDLVPAAELGGAWAARVNRVLRRCQDGRASVVARTEAADLVGVSHEFGRGGLDVVSVIAAPDVAPANVIAAAYDVAAHIAGLRSTASFVPAFDLPLSGHSWVVRERVLKDFRGPERIERSEVTIPGWTAHTELKDLIATPGTGFAEIANAILALLPPDPRGGKAEAAQAATGRFDTNGFSAAALTVMRFRTMAMPPPPRRTLERTVEVRFDRPFAVVAATNTSDFARSGGVLLRGLPAFGAWVTDPMEPSDSNETPREHVMDW